MSHFNLGGSKDRKKFIGPQHRLGTAGLNANLENIGGRILVENEMINHKHRMTHAKASIDARLPWAHKVQEELLVRPSSGATNRVSSRINTATENDRNYNSREGSPPRQAASGLGNNRPASAGGGGGHPPSRPSTANALSTNHRSQQRQQSGARPSADVTDAPPFHVSMLPADHQQVYREMIRVLCTLAQKDSKALLEEMYKESEDKKLLIAYTGVFPEMA